MLVQAAAATASQACEQATQHIPPRPAQSLTGSSFAQRVREISGLERDREALEQLRAGNLPAFMRRAVPVEIDTGAAPRRAKRITLCVLPDYLAVGSDSDYLLMPLGLAAALSIAEAFAFTLPTTRIVDAIYAQADLRLKPQPLPPNDQMRSTAYVLRHNAMVLQQRSAVPAAASELTAGHKKDLVLTNRLWQTLGRVAIYGWHRGVRAPIQPLSTVHGAGYADYSHGVRLIGTTVFIDGQPRSLFDVLRDPLLSPLLSDEGPIEGIEELSRQALTARATGG
ncbi:hypothetical protein [Azohydromonas australica]|uniref:hypothetical protein n=1 Tax=Azohydromonas australica TaxID=364039 RepID=UPI001B7FA81A